MLALCLLPVIDRGELRKRPQKRGAPKRMTSSAAAGEADALQPTAVTIAVAAIIEKRANFG